MEEADDAARPTATAHAPLQQLPVEVRQGLDTPEQERTPQHISPISRSVMAYFHQSGLDDFKDSKRHSLPLVTAPPTSSSLPAVSDALRLGPYQIAVQLLGFKL